jgi:predicted TIM-barrel fold metal-dependent hydrolase
MTDISHAPSRRTLLGTLAAIGAVTLVPCGSRPVDAAESVMRIDTHHHFFSPAWKEAEKAFAEKVHGFVFPGNANWTPEKSLEDMEQGGVSKAVLSLASIPGNWFGGDPVRATEIAHACNEFGAQVVRDHPGKFGLLAPLSMIDVDGSVKEIDYAFDVAKADGIGLATVYGNKWPGDPMFDPIFAALNKRKAVVYFHPSTPACCTALQPELNATGGPAMLEVPFDTARCVVSLLVNGSFAKYRDIKWMFAHSGGALPSLAGRINNFLVGGGLGTDPQKLAEKVKAIAPNGVMAEFARLYFDTANAAWPSSMAGLLKVVSASHVSFGSDFPYFSCAQNRDNLDKLGLSKGALAAINSGTAEHLFPRLAKA